METLADTIGATPQVDDVVEGTITAIGRSAVYIDLVPFGTGIIYGREFMNARDVLRKASVGDVISAKVVAIGEHEDGYIELSLKEARQALIWTEAERLVKEGSVLSLEVKDANKGGLILEWQGITGFLPASQLSHEHYPRVQDGDKEKIFSELKHLAGQFISVVAITADAKEQKLIFSEKRTKKGDAAVRTGTYAVGDVHTGEVTGVVDFGIFVKLEEGIEGLVHISEIDWGLVDDTRSRYKVGDVIRVKVIDVKNNKISLSIKQLQQNPWTLVAAKYKKGDKVSGVVIKHNTHGALVSIEEGIAGLVHVSEFASEEALRAALPLGASAQFEITLFVPKEHRMTLAFTPTTK
ncbi:hypothetical protein A3C89_02430 [Candidatus Kaiserbacteria bacterium RIFCSPHIGHO2_02_FULL_50_50]|uniref:S1 motif domain-containing protein n=1 Tax=Candidatus Kaiserbacteria bacterium RIFCSPHIGHO2_02_FULL_50_50 TaxID=1798492 RepID=A0A1F6DDC6_9BACT|nr:MAG: hypothetical protein A3C89_02430 [Candidatus Kaiserbacteria bacterium RIFCSPHIGHO2_02_FULL_50_50]OGG88212.1 MAG: hypothetical protein A3G62_00375 [Candidatus Kaiserbacteria bacterium RIFCSPLOWO2_12_FULL_50_10]